MAKRNKRVDTMTKEDFVQSWITKGVPPDDPYMRAITHNGLPTPVPVSVALRTIDMAERMWHIREDRKELVEILRSPKRIAADLTEFNDWRRGKGKYAGKGAKMPFSAYRVGKVIDGAINILIGSGTEVNL